MAWLFARYGLQDRFLGLWLIDQSRHAWRVGGTGLFDAIVTDPPYGIREGARKVAVAPPPPPSGADQKAHPASYWRQLDTGGYAADTVFADLLDFAAQFLCLNGRLVYWLPVIPATYTDEQVTTHFMCSPHSNTWPTQSHLACFVTQNIFYLLYAREIMTMPVTEACMLSTHTLLLLCVAFLRCANELYPRWNMHPRFSCHIGASPPVFRACVQLGTTSQQVCAQTHHNGEDQPLGSLSSFVVE